MLEFVVCDDDKFFLNKVIKIINKIMINKNIDYVIKKYYDYDNEFLKEIDNVSNNRIYILDIETPSRSGIVIANMIRRVDIASQIIFLTGHEELGILLLRQDIMFVSFINKFEELEERLSKSINKSLQIMDKKPFLRFVDRNIKYNISFDKIQYIAKEKVGRKTIIVTNNNKFLVNISLTSIEEGLDNNFRRTHRSCIVNMTNVEKIDFKNNIIYFNNGLKIGLLSSKYKGGLK